MAGEEHKARLRSFIERCVNTGNAALLDEYVAADVRFHTLGPGPAPGIEGIRQSFHWFRSVFPDLQVTIEQLIAEDDLLVARFTGRGTHMGELQGAPPSGRQLVWTGIDIYRFRNGKIADWWREHDVLSLLQQAGALLQPAAASQA